MLEHVEHFINVHMILVLLKFHHLEQFVGVTAYTLEEDCCFLLLRLFL